MAITTHQKLRRVCQWAFRTNGKSNFASCSESWDGAEDGQSYIDRAWTWRGPPVTFAQIEAQEAAYDAAIAATQETNAAEREVKAAAGQKAMYILIELVDQLLANGTIQATDFTTATRQVYQDLKAAVDKIK